jgi:hypothetical protein
VISSANLCTSTFLEPAGTSGKWMASGTQGTCEAQGFFAQLGLATTLYSASLSLHFMLRIRNVSAELICRRIEPVMHTLSILFPLITAFVALFLDLFNPLELGVGCWIASYPTGCSADPEVECTRGENALLYVWLFGGPPLILGDVTVTVCMAIMFLTVRKQTRKVQERYDVVIGQNSNAASNYRLKQIALQGSLYVGAFFLTYIWTGTLRLVESDVRSTSFFILSYLDEVFYPLQGFMNFFIYIRPRFIEQRRKHPDDPWWNVVAMTFDSKKASRSGPFFPSETSSGRRLSRMVSSRFASFARRSSWLSGPSDFNINCREKKPPDRRQAEYKEDHEPQRVVAETTPRRDSIVSFFISRSIVDQMQDSQVVSDDFDINYSEILNEQPQPENDEEVIVLSNDHQLSDKVDEGDEEQKVDVLRFRDSTASNSNSEDLVGYQDKAEDNDEQPRNEGEGEAHLDSKDQGGPPELDGDTQRNFKDVESGSQCPNSEDPVQPSECTITHSFRYGGEDNRDTRAASGATEKLNKSVETPRDNGNAYLFSGTKSSSPTNAQLLLWGIGELRRSRFQDLNIKQGSQDESE